MKIDETTIASLLMEAGAPTTGESTDLSEVVELVGKIPDIIADREWLEEQKARKFHHDRAKRAADELRCVVPLIVAFERRTGDYIGGKNEWIENADRLDAWLQQMPDFLAMPSSPHVRTMFNEPEIYSSNKVWQGLAVLLFAEYQSICGPCGISADGPAARFIKGCFDLCGAFNRVITLEAIEKAVRKGLKKVENE
jgi:hypothetical protein